MRELLSILTSFGDKRYNFVDTPGHTDYFVNAIKGASQVDVAVLMLDCTKFASGMEGGNTRQLISLIKGNEIKDLIICLNKMDAVEWKEEVFNSIKYQLEAYFATERMGQITKTYIPISAYTGDNLKDTMKLPWYHGESFMKELLKVQHQDSGSLLKPLRMSVKNVFKSALTKKKGLCLTVKVEGGVIVGTNHEKLRIMPSELAIQVKSIFREDEKIDFAKAGDTVDLVININKEEDFENIAKGDIICSDIHPIPLVKKYAY
jgi:translation elongation factor EF-1alpha